MQANKKKEQQCSECKKIFPVETHFQFRNRAGATKMCILCRNRHNKNQRKTTSFIQKRRNIYLYHKKKEIEKSRGCQWPNGCLFNFSEKPSEIFVVCEKVKSIVIFEFDHTSPAEKSFQVSNWVHHAKKNEQDLVDEMEKCRIICSFHHYIHTQNQRNEKKKNKSHYSETMRAIRNREYMQEIYERLHNIKLFGGANKKFGKCKICERLVLPEETSGFHFDHIDPTEKYRAISAMVGNNYSWRNSILPEIDKCRLLCANCHRIHTQEQRVQSNNENVKIVCRKRKHYCLPPKSNEEELDIHEKGERPTKEELYYLVKRYSFVDVGKMYGVNCATIQRWCKKEEIPHKRRKLMEEEYE